METKYVGDGKVYLISGGGKCFTDIAARFVSSERSVEEIIASPYNKKIVENIINRGHLAATEFDYWVFGVEGYSRVTETQLVRKRIASYLIKSGRYQLGNKRKFSVVIPKDIKDIDPSINITLPAMDAFDIDYEDFLSICEQFYMGLINLGFKDEDARYFKPQATEFKAIIGMNTHSLHDFFKVRYCNNAQFEIRDMAKKMYNICKELQPDLFQNAGPNCKVLGYCPEGDNQCEEFKGKIHTLQEVKDIVKNYDEFNRVSNNLLR